MATRRQQRADILRLAHFTPLEVRELSKLPRNTPALKQMVQDRVERRARFEKLAATKIASGRWKRGDVQKKWLLNLSRMYTKRGWRVKEGATGKQQPMPKGSPNPWAVYRNYDKQAPDKAYLSPWEIRQVAHGKTRLEKGLVFVQTIEKQAQAGKGLNKSVIRNWVEQKNEAIKKAKGGKKAQLMIERNRLERLL